MVVPWSVLSKKLETDIDIQYGEDVVISPYKKSTYMNDTMPDPSRPVRQTEGYRISKYTNIVNAGGGGAAFISKRATADLLMEVREENCPDILAGDRALLRGQKYEVSFVEYWGNGRSVMHLIKRHD